MSQLSGYLLASTLNEQLPLDYFTGGMSSSNVGLRETNKTFQVKHIDQLVLSTPEALTDEEDPRPGQIFHYPVYLIRGFSKVVILAERKNIADYVFFEVLAALPAPRLRKVSISIDDLIEFAEKAESEFLVTSLAGRYAGSGKKLRTILLYGDEVTDSAVFREHRKLFNFYSCGIGRRLFDGIPRQLHSDLGEILRIQNDGSVSGTISNRANAAEFIRVINFVVQNRWVENWVPISPEDSA